jgi:3,4-dihydroxy-2-butanone 4-phosphate synthase
MADEGARMALFSQDQLEAIADAKSGMFCASTREAVSKKLKLSTSCSRSCAEDNPNLSVLLPYPLRSK